MIYGIGVDVVHIPNISRVYNRFGDRFLRRAYNRTEIDAFKVKLLLSGILTC